jgi:hypothetical protein
MRCKIPKKPYLRGPKLLNRDDEGGIGQFDSEAHRR